MLIKMLNVNTLSQKDLPWFVELSDKYDKVYIFRKKKKKNGATCHTGGYYYTAEELPFNQAFNCWPAQSPDLKPIEHIWSCLDKLIDNKRAIITALKNLVSVVCCVVSAKIRCSFSINMQKL
jgi:hypothetical protein